jgi:DNA-binding winged helix-turn-helix (wHTH) protein
LAEGTAPARFGPFELDTRTLELRRAGEAVALEPKPLRLLLYLFEHRDRVLSKEELLRAVWPDESVGDAALAGALRNVRRALGDTGDAQRWIRTRRRVGYQFVGPVTVDAVSARRRIWGAPRGLSLCFVGRAAELDELEQRLCAPAHASVQVSIEGLAGIGKTELALQLVHRLAHADRFPGGIFWLDAAQVDLRSQWGGELAEQRDIRPGPADARCADLLRELENGVEPLLVVLDNVEEWRTDARPGPLPRGAHVSLLVTTRRHNLAAAQFKPMTLGVLAAPHDRALVTALAGSTELDGLDALLEQLGGHALGLELAGAFLGTFRSESPRTYLERLAQNADAVERSVADRVREERTLRDTFRTLWDHLPSAVRDAWWLASFFESGHVSREIALASGIGPDELRELESVHVIQCDEAGLWTMHPLLREFAQHAGPEPSGALAMLLAMGPELLHRRHLGLELRRVYQRAVELAAQTGQIEEVLRALDGLWHARGFQAAWHEAGQIARMLDELTADGASDRNRLVAHRACGGVLFFTGRFAEARERLELAAELCRKEPPLTRAVTDAGVFTFAHLALCCCLLGFPDRGLALIDEGGRMASRTANALTLATALCTRVAVHTLLRELEALPALVSALGELGRVHELPMLDQMTAPTAVWLQLVRAPDRLRAPGVEADRGAIVEVREALRESTTFTALPQSFALLAEACSALGERELGLDLIDDALRLMATSGERYMEAEIWRVRGLLASTPGDARACLARGLAIATEQGARLFALRCATDLVERADGPGSDDARVLAALYAGFSEGFARPDLVRARSVMQARG